MNLYLTFPNFVANLKDLAFYICGFQKKYYLCV